MQQENVVFYNSSETEEELDINPKKLWMIVWNRRNLVIKVLSGVLLLFILLTFILPKQYIVSTDLYINKGNSSNITDINPFVLSESSGSFLSAMGSSDKSLNNEIELMKSALVLDNVIRENNIKYTKGKRKGEYVSAKGFYGTGKYLQIEAVKGTSVVSVSYKSRNPEFSYKVIESFINNYIALHKELNTIKAKSDKALLESEYNEAKQKLESKITKSKGLPVEMITGSNRLATMYSYSKAASNAIEYMKNQYLEGSESKMGIDKDAERVRGLADKLEWAEMVEQMSDTSKVIVINEPQKLLKSENSFPNLTVNIILGIIFGLLASFVAVLFVEHKDKKLSYSVLSNEIIFDGFKRLNHIKLEILSKNNVLMILLEKVSDDLLNDLRSCPNLEIVYPSMSKDFTNKINNYDSIIIVSKIGSTNTEIYRDIKDLIKQQNKKLMYDILL